MNKTIEKIYRIALLAVAIVATVLTITDHVASLGPSTLYFTSWSVWIALVAAIGGLVITFKAPDETKGLGRCLRVIKFSANIMVIATFIVSAFVLPNKIWMAGYWDLGSIFKHFLLPIMTVLDAVLFCLC